MHLADYAINMSDYGYATPTNRTYVMKIGRIKSPSRRAAICDVDRWDTYDPAVKERSEMVRSSASGIGEWRHGNGKAANVGFADGHVELRSKESIPEDGSDAVDGYFWNTPERN